MAGIVITKVVRQVENVVVAEMDNHGMTFGQLVDEHMLRCLSKGDEVQAVSIEMETSEWDFMRKRFLKHDEAVAVPSKAKVAR